MSLPKLAAVAFAAAVAVSPLHASEKDTIVAEAFALAMRDINSGNPELAIPLLRGILARDPGLNRVRLELARAYYEAGEFTMAGEQFRLVLSSSDLPTTVREKVMDYLRRIDDRRGFSTAFSLALVAPTGAGRSYDDDTVMLDLFGTPLPFELSRPEVPVRAWRLEAGARKQWPVSANIIGGRASSYLRGDVALEEAEGPDYDTREAEVGVGLRLTWPRQTASAEIFYAGRGKVGELSETRQGLELSYGTRSISGRAVFASMSFANVDDRLDDQRDGEVMSGKAGIGQSFAARGSLGFVVGAEIRNAARSDYGYWSADMQLNHRIELAGGISLASSAWFKLFEPDAATPGFTDARTETEHGVSFRVAKNDFLIAGRYTPYVGISVARRDSSLAAFSYDQRNVELGVSGAF